MPFIVKDGSMDVKYEVARAQWMPSVLTEMLLESRNSQTLATLGTVYKDFGTVIQNDPMDKPICIFSDFVWFGYGDDYYGLNLEYSSTENEYNVGNINFGHVEFVLEDIMVKPYENPFAIFVNELGDCYLVEVTGEDREHLYSYNAYYTNPGMAFERAVQVVYVGTFPDYDKAAKVAVTNDRGYTLYTMRPK